MRHEGGESAGIFDGGNFEEVGELETVGAIFDELVHEGEQDFFRGFAEGGEPVGVRLSEGFHAVEPGAGRSAVGELGERR